MSVNEVLIDSKEHVYINPIMVGTINDDTVCEMTLGQVRML
jgi:hypothetical protein